MLVNWLWAIYVLCPVVRVPICEIIYVPKSDTPNMVQHTEPIFPDQFLIANWTSAAPPKMNNNCLISYSPLLTVSFFFAISDKVFLTDIPKCHTSNWCNILGYSLYSLCRSVVSVVNFIDFQYFSSKVCNLFFSILQKFPAVLTWTTVPCYMFCT